MTPTPLIELLGWVGSVLFALCALPQAWHAWKNKHADGITWAFLLMWGFGEILTLIYVMLTTNQTPLIANYIINLLFLFVIFWYKIKSSIGKFS